MRKDVMTLLLILFSNVIKGINPYRKKTMDLAQLKMSMVYLKSIRTLRLLFASLLGMGVCLVLLVGGFIIFNVTLFVYTPWSMGTKMLLGFLLAAGYLAVAAGVFWYIFSQEKWLKIFYADSIIDKLERESALGASSENPPNGHKNGNTHRETTESYR